MNRFIRSVALGSMITAAASVLPLAAQEAVTAQDASATGRKSGGAAFRASLFGTLVPVGVGLALAARGPTNEGALAPIVLIVGGLAVGPSLGHFYAGRPARASVMAAARAGVSVGSLVIALTACPLENCTDDEEATAVTSMLVGGAVVAVLAIYDIVSAPSSVRAYNRRISLAPFVSPGDRGAGVMATLRF